MTKTVLIIGGYGVFGGNIAMALAKNPQWDVVVAGRSLPKATMFCTRHGGRAVVLDVVDADLTAQIAALAPFVVIDAAGPFQMYKQGPYRIAMAALKCGAHYLDLSDDAEFTKGIDALDAQAKAAGVTVLSGVSSVPALSSAAVVTLSKDMQDIHLIDSVILPGNRAPRGMSVMRAILAQVGRPIKQWRAGRVETVFGWSGLRREMLEVDGVAPVRNRRSSLIGAPDLVLFPPHFKARTVSFRAGLDLRVMHWGLAAIGCVVRLRVLRSAEPLVGILKRAADLLARFGSDRGGMRVRVVGVLGNGDAVVRVWSLIAEAGDGPHIPAVPARLMCGLLLTGAVKTGARACLGEFTLQQAQDEMADLKVGFGVHEAAHQTIFQQVLGVRYSDLPVVVQDLHFVLEARRWRGQAEIRRGGGMLAQIICRITGFPPAGRDVPVIVTMQRKGMAEHWQRNFDGKRFTSVMTAAGVGAVWERFGPFSFEIPFSIDQATLGYPVRRARLFGVPWPKALTPISVASEGVDAKGRVTFDVAISLPIVGRLVHYKGWLLPDEDATAPRQ